MIQENIWKKLYRTKVHAIYLELLHARTENIDRTIKMFLAIFSSGSIAAWAIWNEAEFIWASLIATTQVINAIRPFLPYSNRMKALSALSVELESLAIHMEIKWIDISVGELTDKEMRKLYTDMIYKTSIAESKCFPNNSIPHSKTLMSRAEISATSYLSNHLFEVNNDE